MHLSGYSPYSKYSEFVCSVLHATYYEREFPKTKQYFFPTNIPSECFTQKGSGWFFMSKEFYAGKSWLTSLNWWKSIWKVSMNTRMIGLKYVSWFFWLVLFWSFFCVCVKQLCWLLCNLLTCSGFYNTRSQIFQVSCHAAIGIFTTCKTWFF